MKFTTMHLCVFAIGILILLGFSRNQSDDYYEIGDVKYSILPPNTFNKTQKGSWVLLDGKPMAEDQKLYALLEQEFLLDNFKDANGVYTLPDARGNFIRSMNVNGQGNDPQAGRLVGSYQADALKTHQHSLQNTIYKHGRSFKGDDDRDHTLKHAYGSVWAQRTNDTGDANESRPKNITLYCYIKVSN